MRTPIALIETLKKLETYFRLPPLQIILTSITADIIEWSNEKTAWMAALLNGVDHYCQESKSAFFSKEKGIEDTRKLIQAIFSGNKTWEEMRAEVDRYIAGTGSYASKSTNSDQSRVRYLYDESIYGKAGEHLSPAPKEDKEAPAPKSEATFAALSKEQRNILLETIASRVLPPKSGLGFWGGLFSSSNSSSGSSAAPSTAPGR